MCECNKVCACCTSVVIDYASAAERAAHLAGGSRPCTMACRLRRHSPSWCAMRHTC